MNRLQSEDVDPISQPMAEFQPLAANDNDDIDRKNDRDNEQAKIRRRAPTRHSIKAAPARKILTKQTSLNEVKKSVQFFLFIFFIYMHSFYSRCKLRQT